MGIWIGVGIIFAIAALIVRRGLQMKALAHQGVPGQARVIAKSRRRTTAGHQTAGYIKYQFDTVKGHTLTNRIAVSEKIFSEYAEGDSIDIVYLEDRPKINAAKYMVNLSRKALKMPPM